MPSSPRSRPKPSVSSAESERPWPTTDIRSGSDSLGVALNHTLRLGSGLMNQSDCLQIGKMENGAAMNPSPEPLVTLGSRVNSASGSWSGRPDLNRRPQRPERCALNQLRYSPTHTLL